MAHEELKRKEKEVEEQLHPIHRWWKGLGANTNARGDSDGNDSREERAGSGGGGMIAAAGNPTDLIVGSPLNEHDLERAVKGSENVRMQVKAKGLRMQVQECCDC